MKKLFFEKPSFDAQTNIATMVSLAEVEELKNRFVSYPKRTELRFGQDAFGRLILRFLFRYEGNTCEKMELIGDLDLVRTISAASVGDFHPIKEYLKTDHEAEVAEEGENLKMELFKQYLESGKSCYIEPDWLDSDGQRYRCVTFSHSFKVDVKFTMLATNEVNELIRLRCMPQWKRKAEGLDTVQQVG